MLGEAMKCGEFEKIVDDLARSGPLGEAETLIARAHAETCPVCACRLAEAETLAAILRQASAESRSLEAPERVESQLMAAFRAARGPSARPAKKLAWRWVFGWAGAGAVAAAVFFAWLGRGPARPVSPALQPAEANAKAAAVPGGSAVVLVKTASRAIPAAQSAAYFSSGFVPVPFAGGFARGDSGVIVRVRVPRSALAELGYPVDETQGQGIVQADLLVGEDGWPRAVRIVK